MAGVDVSNFVGNLEKARTRFLYGLDCVPDDRLNWTPGGAAKTPLQLGDKAAGFIGFINVMIQGQTPDRSAAQPPASESRDEAKGRVDASFQGLQATVGALTQDDLARSVTMPWGEVITVAALLPGAMSVVGYLQGQLNYVQMAYGDENPNIPPDWHPHQ